MPIELFVIVVCPLLAGIVYLADQLVRAKARSEFHICVSGKLSNELAHLKMRISGYELLDAAIKKHYSERLENLGESDVRSN